MPQLGAHMSIAGGMNKALERGQRVGCDVVQVFTRNSNRWHSPKLSEEQISAWQDARCSTDVNPVAAHGSYLVNLASPDAVLWERSIAAVQCEIAQSKRLSIPQYVLHPGAHRESGHVVGIERIATALDRVLEATLETRVLLETTAGQGTSIGRSFEELASIRDRLMHGDRVGFCLDTAHVFAAGYDLRSLEAYASTWKAFDSLLGLQSLGLVHLNDSKRELASRVDRHEHIGRGFIGLQAFWRLVNDPCLSHVPMVLETPKDKTLAQDKWSLDVLRSLQGATLKDMEEIANGVLENGPG